MKQRGPSFGTEHRRRDAEKLDLHRIIAKHLRGDPARVLAIARENLRRWQKAGAQPYYEEWEQVLATCDVDEIIGLILADNETGRRLRQSTPFTGVVSETERGSVLPTR